MIPLHYKSVGDIKKPPLVLIHGLFGNGNNLLRLAKELRATHHVILPDQRNHGKSPWHDHMNYPAMADDIATMLNSMHIDKAIIAGHSMGGKTAMKFTLRYPHRVSKLIVLDIAPVKYQHSINLALAKSMHDLDLEKVQTLHQAKQELPVSDPTTKLFLLQNLIREEGQLKWRLNLPALLHSMPTISNFPRHTKSTDRPALFVYGNESDYVQAQHHAEISRIFSNNSIVPIAGANHWLHSEQALATAGAISQFI